ncbi:pyridoxamine 5'-phosphate oxidase family protein [Streptomyces sp. SID3343]|uniref:pyridoxamine 5'-phosphate oxidase family protein n=1 Tax=Streptomyces sp. SID3343 TaxID=2690260 RepID=UPI00136CE695|nr:pyridoxamine 5'-phosphate oxidase family protein [Streptomyces sp. SID3343]MYW02429.1 pyridoxamine 5'-phosphate oxidase family protein [Streptomyces sp. SID3343]
MTSSPRTPQQRRKDTLFRLEHEDDAWVSTADADTGTPYLVPLSFLWEGDTLLISTPAGTVTGRNLRANGRIRLGIGPTRDLIMIEGTAQALAASEIPAELGDAFAAKAGFDPRVTSAEYVYFRIRPQRLQAWRQADEIAGRDLVRDGQWIVD